MTIHIPDEVVYAGAKKLASIDGFLDLSTCPFLHTYLNLSRSTITTALEAWVKTGMAKSGYGDGEHEWSAYSQEAIPALLFSNDEFPVIIIRTEAL